MKRILSIKKVENGYIVVSVPEFSTNHPDTIRDSKQWVTTTARDLGDLLGALAANPATWGDEE